MTLDGYRFFSLSFSVKGAEPSLGPWPAETFEVLGRDVTATEGESVLGIPDTEIGESGTVRLVMRLSTYERCEPKSHTRLDHFTDTSRVDAPTYLDLQ